MRIIEFSEEEKSKLATLYKTSPKPPRKVNHIKMQVVPDLKSDTAAEIVKERVDYQSEIQSVT